MSNIGLPEIAIVLMIVLVIFGPKRLPATRPLARQRDARVQGRRDRQHKDDDAPSSTRRPAEPGRARDHGHGRRDPAANRPKAADAS